MSVGVLVAVGPVDFEADVLGHAAAGPLHVVRRCVDVADLLATAATRQAAVALVSAGLHGLDAEAVATLRDERTLTVAVVSDEGSPDAPVMRALGVDAVLALDVLDRLADTVSGLLGDADDRAARAAPSTGATGTAAVGTAAAGTASAPRRRGQVVTVWGPTGAPGRSIVSSGLAAAFAGRSLDTLLVDADVYGGAQGQLLGMLDESSGLLAAARSANRGRLDGEVLAAHARSVSPCFSVLTGLPRSDRWVELGPVLLRRILDAARDVRAVTVVDAAFCLETDEEVAYDVAAPRRNGATIAALHEADVLLVVGSADPVGLGRLLRALSDLRATVPDARPWVVVNRTRSTLGWSTDDIAAMVRRTTGFEVAACLPDDVPAVDRAVVQGRSLRECAAGSRLTKAVDRLAGTLADQLQLAG